MVRRSFLIAFEICGALLAIAIVTAGIFVWRVSQGPISLDFVTPHLERQLSALNDDIQVELGGTLFTWEGWPETFALRVRDIRLTNEAGQLARIPEADLKLDVPALINGTVAPTHITARGATVTVIRDAKGLRFAGLSGGRNTKTEITPVIEKPPKRDVSRILPPLLSELMATPQPGRPLAYLTQLKIVDASVMVRDARLGTVWRAPNATMDLLKTDRGLAGHARLDVALGEGLARTQASVSYIRDADTLILASGFSEIAPAALAAEIPALADANGMDMTLSGHAAARVALNGTIERAKINLHGGPGHLRWPRYLPERRPVRDLKLALTYNGREQTLTARAVRIAFGTSEEAGPLVTGTGKLERQNRDLAIRTNATVTGLSAAELGAYWPPGLQERGKAREWVTKNIPQGDVDRAEVEAALRIPDGDFDRTVLDSLEGEMRYSAAVVHYLPELPPVRGVSGKASFDKTAMTFDIRSGHLKDIRVTDADVEVTGLHRPDQFLAIDLTTAGPLAGTLAPLAHPRLDLLSDLGVSPGQTSGQANVSVQFDFPLEEDLTMDGVAVQAQADLQDVAATDFLFGKTVQDGNLHLRIDKTGMTLSGPLKLAAVPMTMTWQESFIPDASPQRAIEARIANFTEAARTRLGYDTAPYLTGPISLALTWRGDGAGTGHLLGAVNLKDAGLDLIPVKWRKPSGSVGQATFDLLVRGNIPRRLETFEITAEGPGAKESRFAADGRIHFGEAGHTLQRAVLTELRVADTYLRDITATQDAAGWQIRIGGGYIDAAPYLPSFDTAMPHTSTAESSHGGEPDKTRDTTGTALMIEAGQLDHIRLGANRRLHDVRLRLKRQADGDWSEIRARARIPPVFLHLSERKAQKDNGGEDKAQGAPIAIDFAERGDGRHTLNAVAGNAGATLRAFDLADSLTGGRLTLKGVTRGTAPDSPIDAKLKIRSFQVREAPFLARLLSVALLTGIADALDGDGLSFQRLQGDIVLDGQRLETDLLHAYGPAIGITARGMIDAGTNEAKLDGVLVPAALVNEILGAIPLFGPLITGGEGEGLIAMLYKVRGRLDEPDISVNPLSILTPGFLRGLFGARETGPSRPNNALPTPDRQQR